MLALDVLGPFVLRRNGIVVPLAIKKTQALLLLLAVAGAQRRERLAALLWPQLDESTGRRNLRRELARLRESGLDGWVRTDGDLLQLAASVECDLWRFEAATSAGERLALWRGLPADGLRLEEAEPFEQWLAGERERLRRRWRQALEDAAGAAPPDLAVGHLQALLDDDPLHERHHRALIQLHLAAGRREAALAQYASCRELLDEQLGLSPMAETEALIASVRASPVLTAAPPVAVMTAVAAGAWWSGPLPFVGREAEVQALQWAWRDGRLLLIEGEGGVGKSRLAVDFCAALGPYALLRCRPGDAAVPYAAYTRALRVLAGESLATAGLPDWVQAELRRVLPELGAPPPPLQSAEDRARFVEACAQAWQRLADGNFDAVVVDDWQHADEPSQALLAFIAQRLGPASARLLVLTRGGGAGALAGASALHLQLEPLAAEPVLHLVRQLSGAASPERFAGRLSRATGGNPFFIAETLRHLAETGALRADALGRWSTAYDDATEDYRELPLPATVRDAVLARVRRLPDASRRLLEAASLASEPFAPALVAAACALSELEALAAIEHAVDARLLREHEQGGFGFGHDLAQQALDEALSPERRRLVHRRLALAAEATRADPALAARHFEAGGEPARAVAGRLAAGDEAQRLFAGPQALQHWQQALADGPTPAQAAQLLVRCARAHADLGEGETALEDCARLRALVAEGRIAADERAAMLLDAAEIEITLNRAPQGLPVVDALLATLADGALRARALRVRGQALHNLGRLDEAAGTVQAALALWPPGEPAAALERAALLNTLLVIEYQRGKVRPALALAHEASALWRAHGDRRSIVKGHYRVGVMMILDGAPETAEVELNLARQLAHEMHLVEQERETIINLIKIHADRGDAQRMLALADEGWNLSPHFGRPRLRQVLLQARCHAHTLLGELGAALRIAEQFLAESAGSGEPVARQYAVLTSLDLLVYVGDFDRGRALLQELAGTREMAYLGVKLAFNLTFLELRAGQPDAARAALANAGDPQQMDQAQDRATHALRLAEMQLGEGDAEAALASLAPWRDGLPNTELLAQVWAARLQAQHRLGRVSAVDWQHARKALDEVALPAVDALELRLALVQSAGDPAQAESLAAAARRIIASMAASLADWPAYRAGFLARFVTT